MVGTEHYNSQLWVKQAITNELALRDFLVAISGAAVNGWPANLADFQNLTIEEIDTLIAIIQTLIENGEAVNSELYVQAGFTQSEIHAVWEAINQIYSGFAAYTNAWRDCDDHAEIDRYESLIEHVKECAERVTPNHVPIPCHELPPYTPPVVTVPPPVEICPPCPETPVSVPPIEIELPNPVLDCPPYERCPPCPVATTTTTTHEEGCGCGAH